MVKAKNKNEYRVGLVRGAVVDGETKKLGDIVTVDLNTAAILQNVNRGKVIGDDYSEDDFKAEVNQIRANRESVKKGSKAA